MSEQEQHRSGGDPEQTTPEQRMLFDIMDRSIAKHQAGAPAETQRSGFGGERRDSGADELSLQAEASEQSSSRRVSRETHRGEMRSDSERPDGHPSSRSFAPPFPTEPTDGSAGAPFGPAKNPTEKPTPPQSAKNKSSSAYVYLAVLFGAAFLMLLLAYFVQQRNNAAVQDDLRTATASREELLEDIKALEEERDWLQDAYDRQRERNDRVDQQNQGLQEAVDRYYGDFTRIYTQYENARTLDYLEQFLHSRDYLMAAAVVANRNLMFDPNYSEPGESQQYATPAQRARYLDLRAELFRNSDLLVLVQEGDESGFPAGMLCVNTDSAMGRDELDTAGYLWSIVLYYAADPDWSAQLLANHYESLTQNSGLFKPSTMELLEEIKEDLTAQGLISEKDGALTANVTQDEPAGEIWEPLESGPAD